jgi:membrane protease YdiL (CAAX protease family)
MNTPSAPITHRSRSRRTASSALQYFALTFAISWTGALAFVAPRLLRSEAIPKFTCIMMFPVMLLGPAISSIVLTAKSGGISGVRALFGRMARRIPPPWLSVLLIPPTLVATVLGVFTLAVSRAYNPNNFVVGLAFGLIAGFVEEIGWTGFAFPAMRRNQSSFRAAILLGLLWSLWHLPVVDYLGAITPHGSSWAAYYLAFAAAMVAMRVLICWAYVNTGSLLLAQLLHACSTGALVVLSPAHITASQEALWYFAYAAALWILVFIVLQIYGASLTRGRPALNTDR